jgi:hypothetical protein
MVSEPGLRGMDYEMRYTQYQDFGGVKTVGTKYVVSDGVRMMEILHVQDMAYGLGDPAYRQGNHSADMLIRGRSSSGPELPGSRTAQQSRGKHHDAA